VRTADGALLGLFSQLQDITARYEAEELLARSEERLRLIMAHAPIGMALIGPDGRWVMANRALCTSLGRTEDELVGITFDDITHPDDLPESHELIDRVLAGELDTFTQDKRYAHADGSWVRVRLTLAFARDADGVPVHAVAQIEDLTEDRRIALELADQERRFRMLTDGAEDIVSARVRTVPELRVEYLSRGAEALSGRPREDYYADPSLLATLTHPEDAELFGRLVTDPASFRDRRLELRFRKHDGSYLWMQSRVEPICDDAGNIVGVDSLSWDVTAAHEAGEIAAASYRRFQALVEHAADAITIRDADGITRYASPAVTDMLGYCPEELVGTMVSLRAREEDRPVLREAVERATATPGGVARAEVRAMHRDGTEKWLALAISNRLDDPDVAGLVIHVHDITSQRAAQDEIAYRASHDALTGLPNRASVQRHLELSLAVDPAGVGVLFVDLRGLKPVNDSLGHAKGDAVLVSVARRIAATVGDAGTVGRFGGDEFAVITRGLPAAELSALADRIVRELDLPVVAPDGGHVYLGATAGIAVADGSTTAEQLLANADLAMYDVKRRTGRGVQLFDSTLAEIATERLTLERDLRDADLDADLRAYYQPLVSLETGRITGAEALLRWQHPARGLVPPVEFIPIAEETGLIDRLGLWVLTRALLEQVAWAEHDLSVGVNLSPRQLFDPDLPGHVAQLLAVTGARADRLVLEVTESALIDDRVARTAIAGLKDLGVGLSLDDFGTGFSSLTSLRRYPFDSIKIDRSFVAEMTGSAHDRAIVANVTHLAHDLGMGVVAEGVETAEQLHLLTEIGADSAQGYHLGRPVPAHDLVGRLGSGRVA
jgi:diguanylate cyclase (GGDEF)-like protein/PAS domain S-box-containing protein